MYWFYNDVCFCIFVSVITVWGSKTALIFYNGILFDGKVNLVGALRGSKFNIRNSFQKRRENKIKIKEKREFLQNRFSTRSILVFGVTLKKLPLIHEIFTTCLYLHFLYTILFIKYDLFWAVYGHIQFPIFFYKYQHNFNRWVKSLKI